MGTTADQASNSTIKRELENNLLADSLKSSEREKRNGTTILANNIIAPDGTMTADKFREGTGV